MEMIRFEWDNFKNRINVAKHKVSFEEASTVFYDPNAIVFDDPSHSINEHRFLILGFSRKAHILIVSHCYREDDQIIRIISARKATKTEINFYNGREGTR